MNIVIVGAKERDTPADRELVNELLDELHKKYPGMLVVTMATHMGIGKFVHEKCLERTPGKNEHKFQLCEVDTRILAKYLSKSEVAEIYLSRNATLFELGNMFYYFASASRRGTIEELLDNRVIPSGRPFKVFLPDDPISLI
jgi:hypothetical protein